MSTKEARSNSMSPESDPTAFMNKWRQTRACARCRRLKMKCAFDNPNFGSCKRCFRSGFDCSFDNDPTAKFARKNRRASPMMVESHDFAIVPSILEGDKSRLQKLELSLGDVSSKLSNIMKATNSNSLRQFQDFHKTSALQECPYIPFGSNIVEEITQKHKLVSIEEFRIRHQFFLDEMLSYYPIISFSKTMTDFDYLYETDPLLLTGCVYVTTINDNGLFSRIKEKHYKLSNEALNQMLNYYLESFISYHVYIKANDFNYRLVDLCLILSLWCLPTTNSGHFKNQFHLLIGFNISLCIDLGDISKSLINKSYTNIPVLGDATEQRNHLRAFLSVYVSCGSLGLSLPRFKVVNWTTQHHTAVTFLMKEGEVDGVKLPTRNDRYLCYFSKVIRLGQEIFNYFSPSMMDTALSKKRDALFNNMLDPYTSSLSHTKFVLDNYEQRLYSLLIESGFMDSPEPESGKDQPKEKYLLSVIYYQLLMIVYDNLVSRYFLSETKGQGYLAVNTMQAPESVTPVQYIVKLIKLCENLLKSFIILGQERTINLPTFFFYRPMHSLILLIKLRILINSSNLTKWSPMIEPEDLKINAEVYFEGVHKLIHESQHKYSSIVCSRMAIILSRIEKWMHLSTGKRSSQPSRSQDQVQSENSNLVRMIDTSKEIENLRDPKEEAMEHNKDNNNIAQEFASEASSDVNPERPPIPSQGSLFSNSLQEIFQTIDSDVINFLNPWDPMDLDMNNSGFDASFVSMNMNEFQNTPGSGMGSMNPNVNGGLNNLSSNLGNNIGGDMGQNGGAW
ncbi:hypothetical protein CANTEDRAFT_117729 [Yamadazyma tenuis ATCC 10573]|uniref:Zn(2)-C6 fungal-type domain-containing protein n=1 Tax=Candida tenuis (strain ATCC 10573 / BCRC 21748 / CBS 615 / JCM 9827 / NBRC 10315 / NRRL Y-1498 / VKM Y-70) TaxID=590646 RepID=G3AWV4_CANTC|nr:uncharacterized protein CANTEDRAFT_117729 [Yamadazyma tenuis ATCC 10573]EGV66627.1 hypothetical protein CANTEDRAFT_117729 [Yamadazyma tenuis ATCC 10573]